MIASRRALAWMLAIPLMVAGSQVAHAVAYRLAYPEAGLRAKELLATGHGYLAWAPRLVGVALAIELIALANEAFGARRRARPVPAWAFVLLPGLGFTIQEFAERLLALHTLPWWMVEQPTFRYGLALQVPVGLITYLIARVLLRTAHAVAAVIRRRRPVPRLRRPAADVRTGPVRASHAAARSFAWGQRGPPGSCA